MIRDAEIRRLARRAGVEPRIVELDYALGWALRGIAGHAYLAASLRTVAHPFSDADGLGEFQLRCYALDEIMAEKVRAVLGQRVYAISRDIYDIFSLMEHVDDRKALAGLPRKMAAREIDTKAVDLRRMTKRKDEFRADWSRNLASLLPPGAEREFDDVWESVVDYVGRMAEGVDRNRRGAQ